MGISAVNSAQGNILLEEIFPLISMVNNMSWQGYGRDIKSSTTFNRTGVTTGIQLFYLYCHKRIQNVSCRSVRGVFRCGVVGYSAAWGTNRAQFSVFINFHSLWRTIPQLVNRCPHIYAFSFGIGVIEVQTIVRFHRVCAAQAWVLNWCV